MGVVSAAVTTVAPIFIITSPFTSYSDQIYAMHRTRSSAGFSLDIPLIMLTASILKIFYWFGPHYATSLLLQSCLMIAIQLVLLYTALKHRPPPSQPLYSPAPSSPFPGSVRHGRPYNFWQWPSPKPYFTAVGLLSLALLVLHLLLFPTSLFTPYTSLLGTLALTIEATLPFPQLFTNFQRRGCKGFRVSVLANWLLGDAFKLWFFWEKGSGEGGVPPAFWICAYVQACCDAGLGIQWWVWGDGAVHKEVPGLGDKERRKEDGLGIGFVRENV